MPELLQKMFNEQNDNIEVFYRVSPGFSLKNHLKAEIETKSALTNMILNEFNLKRLLLEDWDYVILQEGTVRFLIPEVRKYNVETAITEIKNTLKETCRVILFETWVSESAYPKKYCYPKRAIKNSNLNNNKYCSSTYLNSKNHFEAIKEAYQICSRNSEVGYSNNGELFFKFSKKNPEIKLLEDDIHPSISGAYLNACVFYELLTNKSIEKIEFSGKLTKIDAKKIKLFLLTSNVGNINIKN